MAQRLVLPGGLDDELITLASDTVDGSPGTDLGLNEMELGAVSADLDLYPEDAVAHIAERLRFGDSVERALDIALRP